MNIKVTAFTESRKFYYIYLSLYNFWRHIFSFGILVNKTVANSEDTAELQHEVSFHHGLHSLPGKDKTSFIDRKNIILYKLGQ